MASRILFNNGLEIDQAISGAYPNIITKGSGFVRDTGVQSISGVKYFYDRITFYSGINVTGDFVITGSVLGDFYPKVDNAYDLGTSTLEWKNLYLDGTGRVDSLFVDENAVIATGLSVGGNAVISGNLSTIGNSTASAYMTTGSGNFGSLTITGDFNPSNIAAHLLPKTTNLYDLGSASQKFRNLYLDGTGKLDSLEINENAIVQSGLSIGQSATISGNSTVIGTDTASSFMTSGSGAFGKLFVTGSGIPTTSTGAGVFGQILLGSGYLYACTGTNKWGRALLSTW